MIVSFFDIIPPQQGLVGHGEARFGEVWQDKELTRSGRNEESAYSQGNWGKIQN